MSVVDKLAREALGRSADLVGQIQSAWRITPTSLMIIGWQREAPAAQGRVSLQRTAGQQGRFTRCTWTASAGRSLAYKFLAAVQLPGCDLQPGDALMMFGRRGDRDGVLAQLPSTFLGPVDFATELSREATAEAGSAIARYIMQTFEPATFRSNLAIRAMASAFLEQSSVADGCIEIVGALGEDCLYLQGWGLPLNSNCETVLSGATLQLHPVREACFPRPDIVEPPTGQVLILPAGTAGLGVPDRLYVLASDGIRRRPILPERRTLEKADTAGHVRDMMQSLRCDAETRALLDCALRPQYGGFLSLYDRRDPVRFTLDLAVKAEDSGHYLTGWLYDPTQRVASVNFHAGTSPAMRLDDRWTRIPRPDVTAGFAADQDLPPNPTGQHDHGFSVYIPGGKDTTSGEPYVELILQDGWCGFVPVRTSPLQDEKGCATLVASVDLYQPSGTLVIERQLAPFLARVCAPAASNSANQPKLSGCLNLITVPLRADDPPRAILAQFLSEPLTPSEELLFVCGENWSEASIAKLHDLARFYGAARVTTMRVSGVATMGAALSLAARHGRCDHAMLLSAEIVGDAPGWRAKLWGSACDQNGRTCVSPTILYEDHSIRYAGLGKLQPDDVRCVRVERPLAGLPRSFAASGPPVATHGVSSVCCVVPAEVLKALRELPPRPLVAAWEPDLDLLQQMDQLGAASLWLPDLQVHAAEPSPGRSLLERAATQVARHSIRLLSTMGDH